MHIDRYRATLGAVAPRVLLVGCAQKEVKAKPYYWEAEMTEPEEGYFNKFEVAQVDISKDSSAYYLDLVFSQRSQKPMVLSILGKYRDMTAPHRTLKTFNVPAGFDVRIIDIRKTYGW